MSRETISLLATIVNRGDGIALSKLYAQNGVALHAQIAASGTASSELLDMLGLTVSERDLLLSFAPRAAIHALLDRLDDDYRGILSVRGIAFTLPLAAVSAAIANALPTSQKGGDPEPMVTRSDREFSLIIAIVNHGYTDEVMHTACAAGATGGTVIRGRWVGAQLLEQFHGIAIQDEREILLIACEKSARNPIMDALSAAHGLRSEQQVFLCSVPIDRFVRLT